MDTACFICTLFLVCILQTNPLGWITNGCIDRRLITWHLSFKTLPSGTAQWSVLVLEGFSLPLERIENPWH